MTYDRVVTESISDVKCVSGVHHFSSSVLMSIELQQTIGYGQRATSGEVSIYIQKDHGQFYPYPIFFQCWIAIFVQGFQSIFGLLLDAALIGIFFAKMARPGYRAKTMVWSKNAVVSLRDGVLCLVWQVRGVTVVMMVIISTSPGR